MGLAHTRPKLASICGPVSILALFPCRPSHFPVFDPLQFLHAASNQKLDGGKARDEAIYIYSIMCDVSVTFSYPCAGSPTVTSLTFDEQSRTLSCTSTGGLAITVTWRRDGVVITLNATHQQTKRLVDPVEGTYQTVLTINQSVGWNNIVGTYNCTVENVRGESSETVVVTGETRTMYFIYTVIILYLYNIVIVYMLTF